MFDTNVSSASQESRTVPYSGPIINAEGEKVPYASPVLDPPSFMQDQGAAEYIQRLEQDNEALREENRRCFVIFEENKDLSQRLQEVEQLQSSDANYSEELAKAHQENAEL